MGDSEVDSDLEAHVDLQVDDDLDRGEDSDVRYIYPSGNRASRRYEFDKVAKEGEEEPWWALHVAAWEYDVEEMRRCLADPTATGTNFDDTTMNQTSAKCKIGSADDFDKSTLDIPIFRILHAYNMRSLWSYSPDQVSEVLNVIRAMARDPRFNPNVSAMEGRSPLISQLVTLGLGDCALELVGSSRFDANSLASGRTVLSALVCILEDRIDPQGSLMIARALLDRVDIDVNLCGEDPISSPLLEAIHFSDVEMAKLLFADGRVSVGVFELHVAVEAAVTSFPEDADASFRLLSALMKYKRTRSVISSKRKIIDTGAEVPVSVVETALCHDRKTAEEFGYTLSPVYGYDRLRVMDLILESERVRIRGDRVRVEVATRNHARKTARAEGFPEDAEKEIAGWLSQAVIEPADVRRIINRPVYNPHSTIFFQRALFDFESKLNIQRICIDRERFCSKVSTRDFLI